MIQNQKILVTGGAGFIGSNLCEKLLELGNQVVCLDNFSTGKRENVTPLLSNNDFELIEGDIRDIATCHQAVKGVDAILHEAALGSVPRSIKDPATTHEVNTSGFLNMLIAAKDANVKRFIYAASSSTYGDSEALPKVEDNIGKPLSPYAITKYVNELYADVFQKTYGLNTIGLRYFNVFGKRQDPNGAYAAVIPKFVQMLLNHEAPLINGDGSYSRDFTYIDNVLEMNLLALSSSNQDALNQVYNTAFGERTTLKELVSHLISIIGEHDSKVLNIKPVFGPSRDGDIPHSLASIEKAKRLLGYNPKYDFKSGLKETVNWYLSTFTKNQTTTYF